LHSEKSTLINTIWEYAIRESNTFLYGVIVARTKEDAISKLEKTMQLKIDNGLASSRYIQILRNIKPKFSGRFCYQNADQYVEACLGGGTNLHLFKKGAYSNCNGCRLKEECKEQSRLAGEQSVLDEIG